MRDILENQIICSKCDKETARGHELRDGFSLRIFKCPKCGDKWYHPTDLRDFEEFTKIRSKRYHVKLRMVGNSYTVSIPREIIDFENITTSKIVSLFLEEPNKIGLLLEKRRKELEEEFFNE